MSTGTASAAATAAPPRSEAHEGPSGSLLGAAADEVGMGPERRAPPAAADFLPTWIFWCVLAGAVVVLLLLIARLVRQSDGAPGSAAPAASAPPPAGESA